jgi:hypothetical protein
MSYDIVVQQHGGDLSVKVNRARVLNSTSNCQNVEDTAAVEIFVTKE